MLQQWHRYTRTASRAEQGYVLVIVMGLLAILGVMSLSLRAATHTSFEQTRRFQNEVVAEFLAKAGIDWVMHYLNTLERQGSMWQVPWARQEALFQEHALGPGVFDVAYQDATGTLRSGLQDEEARLNINTASAASLATLPGIGQDVASAIVAQRQQAPWHTPEELVRRGLITLEFWHGREDRPGLQAYLTAWGSGKINVNTAPPVVLAAIPGSTAALVEAIVRYRQGDDGRVGTADDRTFRTVQELTTVSGMEREAVERVRDGLTVTPSTFRFIVTGRVLRQAAPAQRHQRFAILERTGQATVLRYWHKVE